MQAEKQKTDITLGAHRRVFKDYRQENTHIQLANIWNSAKLKLVSQSKNILKFYLSALVCNEMS